MRLVRAVGTDWKAHAVFSRLRPIGMANNWRFLNQGITWSGKCLSKISLATELCMCVHGRWGGQGVMPGVREVGQESVAHMGDAATDRGSGWQWRETVQDGS